MLLHTLSKTGLLYHYNSASSVKNAVLGTEDNLKRSAAEIIRVLDQCLCKRSVWSDSLIWSGVHHVCDCRMPTMRVWFCVDK